MCFFTKEKRCLYKQEIKGLIWIKVTRSKKILLLHIVYTVYLFSCSVDSHHVCFVILANSNCVPTLTLLSCLSYLKAISCYIFTTQVKQKTN